MIKEVYEIIHIVYNEQNSKEQVAVFFGCLTMNFLCYLDTNYYLFSQFSSDAILEFACGLDYIYHIFCGKGHSLKMLIKVSVWYIILTLIVVDAMTHIL